MNKKDKKKLLELYETKGIPAVSEVITGSELVLFSEAVISENDDYLCIIEQLIGERLG